MVETMKAGLRNNNGRHQGGAGVSFLLSFMLMYPTALEVLVTGRRKEGGRRDEMKWKELKWKMKWGKQRWGL